MKKVIFICTGNTCRSPMAQGLLEAALEGSTEVSVHSAGVAAMPGQPASRNTTQVLGSRDITLGNFQSRQLDKQMVEDSDLVIALGASHMDVVKKGLGADVNVNLLTDFIDPSEGLVDADIPDPFGMNVAAYEQVAEVIELAIPGILKAISE